MLLGHALLSSAVLLPYCRMQARPKWSADCKHERGDAILPSMLLLHCAVLCYAMLRCAALSSCCTRLLPSRRSLAELAAISGRKWEPKRVVVETEMDYNQRNIKPEDDLVWDQVIFGLLFP